MKKDYIEFQTRSSPLAYLITFRTYGTWLHGDDRGAVSRSQNTHYGAPRLTKNYTLEFAEKEQLVHPPVVLTNEQRQLIEEVIHEVCDYRGYGLLAVNVRTNHVHTVVSAKDKPEKVMSTFKAYATRRMREQDSFTQSKLWSRHGSTLYLWDEESVAEAIDYVVNRQGEGQFEHRCSHPKY